MWRRAVRLIVVPSMLFAVVAASVFGLAKWHPAQAMEPAAGSPRVRVIDGDPVRGRRLFNERCSMCHGRDGASGGIGPRLVGRAVPQSRVVATIERGRGVMPAGLVKGDNLDDVVRYLQTIRASTSG